MAYWYNALAITISPPTNFEVVSISLSQAELRKKAVSELPFVTTSLLVLILRIRMTKLDAAFIRIFPLLSNCLLQVPLFTRNRKKELDK